MSRQSGRLVSLLSILALSILSGNLAIADQFRTLAHFSTLTTPVGDTAVPFGMLTCDGSYLYGTTAPPSYESAQTVFRVNLDGTGLVALHTFFGIGTGEDPNGGVTVVGSRVYGVTFSGGPSAQGRNGDGTVFTLNTDGTNFKVLKTFYSPESIRPFGTVIPYGDSLLGTTSGNRGYSGDFGSIYRINPDGTGFEVLHSFVGTDGSYPTAPLTVAGTSLFGSTYAESPPAQKTQGTLFSMIQTGTNFSFVNLHTFSGPDGSRPQGTLVVKGTKIFGITSSGGTFDQGTIFSMNTNGSGFQTLYSFAAGANGYLPVGGLTLVGTRLYGTTEYGGPADWGTIFSINLDGSGYQVVHSFNRTDGLVPASNLVLLGSTLFGTTVGGGEQDRGTIFSLAVPEPSAFALTMLAFASAVLIRVSVAAKFRQVLKKHARSRSNGSARSRTGGTSHQERVT